MSSAPSAATPSPLPIQPVHPDSPRTSNSPTPRPRPKPSLPIPKLLLTINDLSCRGSQEFLSAVSPYEVLQSAVTNVQSLLYRSSRSSQIPGTRSITLVLQPMHGVAYTTSKDIDEDHKEIHFSTSYIENISAERKKNEIVGVITHEVVHCWQWNALGTAPGGLIEGIADWVRLRAGLAPPHWKREEGGKWDAGYQHTGYFLDHLEGKYGEGSVRRINESLHDRRYDEEKFWTGIFGHPVNKLWEEYEKLLEKEKEVEEEPVLVEKDDGEEAVTHASKTWKQTGTEEPHGKDQPSYLV